MYVCCVHAVLTCIECVMGVASVNRVDPSSPFLIRELLVVKLVSIKFQVDSAAICYRFAV